MHRTMAFSVAADPGGPWIDALLAGWAVGVLLALHVGLWWATRDLDARPGRM